MCAASGLHRRLERLPYPSSASQHISKPNQTEHPRPPSEAYTALKLVCWISTLERRTFSAPYETKDCDAKMAWFLPRRGRRVQGLS